MRGRPLRRSLALRSRPEIAGNAQRRASGRRQRRELDAQARRARRDRAHRTGVTIARAMRCLLVSEEWGSQQWGSAAAGPVAVPLSADAARARRSCRDRAARGGFLLEADLGGGVPGRHLGGRLAHVGPSCRIARWLLGGHRHHPLSVSRGRCGGASGGRRRERGAVVRTLLGRERQPMPPPPIIPPRQADGPGSHQTHRRGKSRAEQPVAVQRLPASVESDLSSKSKGNGASGGV